MNRAIRMPRVDALQETLHAAALRAATSKVTTSGLCARLGPPASARHASSQNTAQAGRGRTRSQLYPQGDSHSTPLAYGVELECKLKPCRARLAGSPSLTPPLCDIILRRAPRPLASSATAAWFDPRVSFARNFALRHGDGVRGPLCIVAKTPDLNYGGRKRACDANNADAAAGPKRHSAAPASATVRMYVRPEAEESPGGQ